MDKDIKQVRKLYKKLLNKYNKSALNNPEIITDYFIVYLKYLRDMRVAVEPVTSLEQNSYIVTLGAAISAYNSYVNCINKYYDVSRTLVERKNKELSEEEVHKQYTNEKLFYFNSFWEIVKTNFESWVL